MAFFKKYLPVLLLVCIAFFLFWANYRPGTFLTGWDDLHSEFNLLEHFKRSIFSLWQEHHGTGDLIGSGYAADLPRLIYIWILSVALPLDLIRYAFHFTMLFVGTIGTYFVINTFFINRPGKAGTSASFFGALFYLFNLGTIQYFSTPFEPFSTFWGMFPWMIYGTLRYLKNPTRKNIVIFSFIHLLATPAVYVFTMFYVYLAVLMLLLLSHVIHARKRQAIRTAVTVFVLFLLVNSFWLLPHLYWLSTARTVQQNATLNKLTTEEVYQKTMQFGYLSDFVLFKNKPWNYQNFTKEGTQFVIQPWHDHFANQYILILGYVLFAVSVLGIFTIKSNKLFVVGFALLSFLILTNQALFAREFNFLFRQIDIVNQVLRDPFTKFIVPTIFIFAVGFSGGVLLLSQLTPAKLRKPLGFVGSSVLFTAFLVYAWPAFSGHLIAEPMRNATPKYYFEFFDFMRSQDPTKRIADLPQGPIWAWESYTWGYAGSGFLWHGLNQPILNRTFDVWNDKNEEYYWELLYAINKKDQTLFHTILEKYQVSYIMFSSAMYFPDNPTSIFTILRQKEFLDNDPQLTKVKTFGAIDLYETNTPNNKYISLIKNPMHIQTETNWLQNDKGFQEYGAYIAADIVGSRSDVFYPFRSLFSGRGSSDTVYNASQTDKSFIFTQSIPSGTIAFPQNVEEEFIRFDPKNLSATEKVPEVLLGNKPLSLATTSAITGGSLQVILEKDNRYGSYDSASQDDLVIGSDASCGENAADKLSNQTINTEKEQYVRFRTTNSSSCRVIYLPELFYKSGYLVAIKSRNVQGSPLHFWVENLTDKRSDLQVLLKKQADFYWEYFVIPPMAEDGIGYTLHFDNISVGDKEIINDLAQVIIYPIPYRFLTETKVTNNNSIQSETILNGIEKVEHSNSASYNVSLKGSEIADSTVLVLSQSYNLDWKAYVVDNWWSKTFPVLFGKELKEHVKINNWANGWDISEFKGDNQEAVTVKIIFVPQYLEYFGFILLTIPFIYALWPRKKKE